MIHCHALTSAKLSEGWSHGEFYDDAVRQPNGAAYYIQQHHNSEWNFYGADWMKWFRRLTGRSAASPRPEIAELQKAFLARLTGSRQQ
jgi:hypothetical protein